MSLHCLRSKRIALSPMLAKSLKITPQVGVRYMATAKRKEFLCILPDNANVLDIRKKVKGIHYEGIKPLVATGKLVDGGGILESHPEEGKDAVLKGSMIVYSAHSAEEVRALLEEDVYATSGVWDLSKAQILPYAPAIREPIS